MKLFRRVLSLATAAWGSLLLCFIVCLFLIPRGAFPAAFGLLGVSLVWLLIGALTANSKKGEG